MKIIGIVAEYNPFHNGHAFHINSIKQSENPDAVVIAMSGCFTQRGTASVLDKRARAEMAIRAGADLVIQLPVYFSVKSAEFFSSAAVRLLSSVGVSGLSFGVECEDFNLLTRLACILREEPSWFKKGLHAYLREGLSFPAAVAKVLPEFRGVLEFPNNILAVEYIKAGFGNLSFFPVVRKAVGHDSNDTCGEFASSSYIRNLIRDGKYSETAEFMPDFAFDIFKSEIEKGFAPVSFRRLESALLLRIRQMTDEDVASICDVSEGLERRIKKSVASVSSLEQLVSEVKCKRYTRARIMRIVMSCFLGLKKGFTPQDISYIHPIAFNKKGASLLKNALLPVVYRKCDVPPEAESLISLDSFAEDCFVSLFPSPENRLFGTFFSKAPLVFK